jgi:hypothetical protein
VPASDQNRSEFPQQFSNISERPDHLELKSGFYCVLRGANGTGIAVANLNFRGIESDSFFSFAFVMFSKGC